MKVESIQQLKQLAIEGKHEYYIQLNFGLKSSKYIVYDKYNWLFNITNEIDDTYEELTESQLSDQRITNIGDAINKGAFFTYD